MCHLALLLPVVGLAVFFVLPLPVALVIYLVILGASVLLYKAVIDVMCRRVVTGREAMLGAHARVKRLEFGRVGVKSGRVVVCVRGELWTARGAGFARGEPQPGEHVVITEMRGNTLVVEPLPEASSGLSPRAREIRRLASCGRPTVEQGGRRA